MKVCHVINSLNRGGAETHLLNLCAEQLKNKIDVYVIAIGPDSKITYSIENELIELGVKIYRLRGPRAINIFSYFRLRGIFKIENFEIIHSHQPRSDFMVYVNKKYSKNLNFSNWVVSIHGKYDTYLDNSFVSKLKIFIFKKIILCWETADNVIVISDEVKNWLYGLNNKIDPYVINYWIKKKNLQKQNLNQKITFGFLGRLNQNKGIEDLISALNKANIEFNCLIGGQGSEQYIKFLKGKIKKNHFERYKFLGYVNNQDEFFKKIDIFIFPSYSEGLGLVLLEALSFYKICITRNVEPMNQLVTKNNGYLFNNIDELIENIILSTEEFKNEAIYSEKINNIEKYLINYDVENLYSKIEQVYKI